MTSEEHADRRQVEEDLVEDLEVDKDSVDSIRGGEITQDVTVNKAKTADKAFTAMEAYIRG